MKGALRGGERKENENKEGEREKKEESEKKEREKKTYSGSPLGQRARIARFPPTRSPSMLSGASTLCATYMLTGGVTTLTPETWWVCAIRLMAVPCSPNLDTTQRVDGWAGEWVGGWVGG